MILRADHSSSLERVDYGISVKVADLSKEANLPLAPASVTAFRHPPRPRPHPRRGARGPALPVRRRTGGRGGGVGATLDNAATGTQLLIAARVGDKTLLTGTAPVSHARRRATRFARPYSGCQSYGEAAAAAYTLVRVVGDSLFAIV